MILSTKNIYLLYILLLLVYVSGLFIPLMENDSAQHATMAMRMYLENDFWNIYVGTTDYLDKPHMHFWLSALSFKLFGINHITYRIPALVFAFLGAVYTNKLAIHLYGQKIKHIASLVFLSAQAIILSNHDVRTDAVLTGATIISIYHFVKYLDKAKLLNLIRGFFALAIGFATKGQLAVFVCGICLLVYVLQYQKWAYVFSWKLLLGLLCYGVFISPVLYGYYVQFDLHPEKVFNGVNNVSGVRFILWDQCFNRIGAKGFNETSPDYFFFFHTLLWAFLPWPIIMYAAMYSKIRRAIKSKFKQKNKFEIMSSFGVLVVLLVISTSKFKLPHYLNSLMPLMSVLVTGYVGHLYKKDRYKLSKRWLVTHVVFLTILATFVIFVSAWAFPFENCLFLLVPLSSVIILFVYLIRENVPLIRKLTVSAVGFVVLINLCLNLQFYPNLLRYQSGIVASEVLGNHQIKPENVYVLEGTQSWSLNFYLKKMLEVVSENTLETKMEKGDWLYLDQNAYQRLKEKGVVWEKVFELTHYRITRLKPRFINPNTRSETLDKRYLVMR